MFTCREVITKSRRLPWGFVGSFTCWNKEKVLRRLRKFVENGLILFKIMLKSPTIIKLNFSELICIKNSPNSSKNLDELPAVDEGGLYRTAMLRLVGLQDTSIYSKVEKSPTSIVEGNNSERHISATPPPLFPMRGLCRNTYPDGVASEHVEVVSGVSHVSVRAAKVYSFEKVLKLTKFAFSDSERMFIKDPLNLRMLGDLGESMTDSGVDTKILGGFDLSVSMSGGWAVLKKGL